LHGPVQGRHFAGLVLVDFGQPFSRNQDIGYFAKGGEDRELVTQRCLVPDGFGLGNKCGRPIAWLSSPPTHSYLLNPLSAPSWRVKGLGEVLRFMHYFAVFKLHYADGAERAALVGDRVFRNPQFAGSEKPPNAEARRIVRVMTAEVLQIPFAVYAFTGLRVIADSMLVVDFMLDILISGRGSGPMSA